MAQDRYVRWLLTIIALALVYLCVVLTPWPAVDAQAQTTPPVVRPGEITSPMPVVVVGWRAAPGEIAPVAMTGPVTASVQNTVQVTGQVTTERARAPRTVSSSWAGRSAVNRPAAARSSGRSTPRPRGLVRRPLRSRGEAQAEVGRHGETRRSRVSE